MLKTEKLSSGDIKVLFTAEAADLHKKCEDIKADVVDQNGDAPYLIGDGYMYTTTIHANLLPVIESSIEQGKSLKSREIRNVLGIY